MEKIRDVRLELPAGVETVDAVLVGERPNLRVVTLPVSIRRITLGAFGQARPMLYLSAPMTVWQKDAMCYGFSPDENAFGLRLPAGPVQLRRLSEAPIVLSPSLTFIAPAEYRGEGRFTELVLPEMVENIGDEAFFGCKKLRKLILPPNLRRIGKKAFKDTALEEVRIPAGVTEIGARAFHNCPVTLIVTPGSCAERHCIRYGIPYRLEE